MHFQRLYMSHVESDHSRYLSSYIFKRTNDVSSDYARRALRKYEDLCAVLLEDEITVRQQSLERLYQQMLELQKVERAWVKASSTLGAPPGGGRFEVNVGPLKIIVTEDGTTVEVSNAKAATVNFVQPEKPTTVTLGTAHPATPTPTVEASRTIH